MDIIVTYEGDTLSLKSNNSEIDRATVIHAEYNENEILTGVKIYFVDFSSESMSAEIDNIEISEGDKIFVWNAVSDENGHAMIPLSEVFMLNK